MQERRDATQPCNRTTEPYTTSTTLTAVELSREKTLRHQNANQLDGFTTLAELMAFGRRDSTVPLETRTYGPLLSVTTV